VKAFSSLHPLAYSKNFTTNPPNKNTLRVHIPRILTRTTLTTRTCATKSISLTKEIYRSYQIFPSL